MCLLIALTHHLLDLCIERGNPELSRCFPLEGFSRRYECRCRSRLSFGHGQSPSECGDKLERDLLAILSSLRKKMGCACFPKVMCQKGEGSPSSLVQRSMVRREGQRTEAAFFGSISCASWRSESDWKDFESCVR